MNIVPIPPFNNVSNIAPFTYKDAQTYLSDLDAIRIFVNKQLIDFINTNTDTLGEFVVDNINALIVQVNTALDEQDTEVDQKITDLTTYVDTQVALIIGNSVITNDTIVKAIFQNLASATRVYTDSIYAAKSVETLVTSGRLTDANLIAQFALKSIETIVTSGRLTVASLDSAYALKSVETLTSSGRLTVAALDSTYALKSIETIVTSGRLSVASLDTAYIDPTELAKLAINQFTTVALLVASTPAGGNQVYASALNAPGMLFRYDTSWKAYGEAFFADTTARNAVLTNAVLTALGTNVRCYLTGSKIRMENSGGLTTTWNKVGILQPTSAVVSVGNGSSAINDDGSLTVTFTSAGNVIIRECIAPIALTDITDIDVYWVGTGAVTFKQSSGGVVDPVTTGYDTFGTRISQDGTQAAYTALNGSSWTLAGSLSTAIIQESTLTIRGALNPARQTVITNDPRAMVTIGTNDSRFILTNINRVNTAFDGLQFAVGGAGVLIIKSRPRA